MREQFLPAARFRHRSLRDDVAPETPAVEPAEAFRVLRSRSDADDREVATDIYESIRRLNLPLVEV